MAQNKERTIQFLESVNWDLFWQTALDPNNEAHRKIAEILDYRSSVKGAGKEAAGHPFRTGSKETMDSQELKQWMEGPEFRTRVFVEIPGFANDYPDDREEIIRSKLDKKIQNLPIREINWFFIKNITEDQELMYLSSYLKELFSEYKKANKKLIITHYCEADETHDMSIWEKLGAEFVSELVDNSDDEPIIDRAYVLTEKGFKDAIKKLESQAKEKRTAKELNSTNRIKIQP